MVMLSRTRTEVFRSGTSEQRGHPLQGLCLQSIFPTRNYIPKSTRLLSFPRLLRYAGRNEY